VSRFAAIPPAGLKGEIRVQSLANIDVAQAGHDPLVQQQGLGTLLAAREGVDEARGVEGWRQRLRPQSREPGVQVHGGGVDEVHVPEPARVVIGHAPAVVGLEDHMGVLRVRVRGVVEFARPHLALWQGDLEASAHPQVHHQGLTAVEAGEQVLGPALQPLDPRADQALDEAVGEREAQVRAAGLDASELSAGQHGLQSAADGLDLGKFRHGEGLGPSRRIGQACWRTRACEAKPLP
jgi:hypothetical protein